MGRYILPLNHRFFLISHLDRNTAEIPGEKPATVKGTVDFNFNTEDHEDFEVRD